MLIFLTMLLLGALIGFVGAGGAGVVIAMLTLVFSIPIHTAIGTSLGAMAFTTFSGALSHFLERNVILKLGGLMGAGGAFGSFLGAKLSSLLPGALLSSMTGSMLFISSLLVDLRIFHSNLPIFTFTEKKPSVSEIRFCLKALWIGLVNGLISGVFGIGAGVFIQLSLLLFFNMPIYQSIGTTMLVILPIAVSGGFGYFMGGHLDTVLFVKVLLGLATGSYCGAKLTRLAPPLLLKTTMVLLPALGGLSLIFL